jgi:alpha-ribazole phosphatase
VKLVLVRHPAVAVEAGVCYGATDVALAPGWEDWCAEVASLAGAIQGQVACVASPLSRCLHPARRLGLDVSPDLRLREMDFGDWEGGRWSDIAAEDLDRWNADLMTRPPPGGESLGDMHARAMEFLAAARGFNGDALIAVTHGGPIRCMLTSVLGMPVPQLFRLRVDMGSVSAVTLDAGGDVLEFMNLRLQPAAQAPPGTP